MSRELVPGGGGTGIFVDFTKEENRKNWKEYLKQGLIQYGCESVWNDNCEYDSMVDKDARVYFEGKGSTIGTMKPVMSNLMCQLSNEAIEEYDPTAVPSRSAAPVTPVSSGMHRSGRRQPDLLGYPEIQHCHDLGHGALRRFQPRLRHRRLLRPRAGG